MDQGKNKEYDKFVLWRCRTAEEKCKKIAIENNIDPNSDAYKELLMKECYSKGFADRDKTMQYTL